MDPSTTTTQTHVISAAVLGALLPEQALSVRSRVRCSLEGANVFGEACEHPRLLDAHHPVWICVLAEERVDRHHCCGGEPGCNCVRGSSVASPDFNPPQVRSVFDILLYVVADVFVIERP